MKLLPHNRLTSAPSTNVLRFLRKQADSVCFFTATEPGLITRNSQGRRCANSILGGGRTSVRHLTTTSPRRQLALEASLLNLEFLPRPENFRLPFLKNASRPGIVIRHNSQDNERIGRYQSSETEEAQWRKWLAAAVRTKASDQPSTEDTQPAQPTYPGDINGGALRSLLKIAPSDVKLRCTEFDENGKVVVTNGEFKKQELIAKVCEKVPETVSYLYIYSMAFFLEIYVKSIHR